MRRCDPMAVIDHEHEADFIATDEDLRSAVREALQALDVTFAELAEQARLRHFSSDLARRTWMVIGDLSQYA
jgi:hypothetical protein